MYLSHMFHFIFSPLKIYGFNHILIRKYMFFFHYYDLENEIILRKIFDSFSIFFLFLIFFGLSDFFFKSCENEVIMSFFFIKFF